uniref:Uncharacterized protein n=1 Tax=Bionectria ochroleuca TaxID=29856 RepID=A0A8H7TP66_BIOOC
MDTEQRLRKPPTNSPSLANADHNYPAAYRHSQLGTNLFLSSLLVCFPLLSSILNHFHSSAWQVKHARFTRQHDLTPQPAFNLSRVSRHLPCLSLTNLHYHSVTALHSPSPIFQVVEGAIASQLAKRKEESNIESTKAYPHAAVMEPISSSPLSSVASAPDSEFSSPLSRLSKTPSLPNSPDNTIVMSQDPANRYPSPMSTTPSSGTQTPSKSASSSRAGSRPPPPTQIYQSRIDPRLQKSEELLRRQKCEPLNILISASPTRSFPPMTRSCGKGW